MRDKIVEVIPTDCDGCVTDCYDLGGEEPCVREVLTPCTLQFLITDKIITLICEEIENVRNPYKSEQKRLRFNSFEKCRYEILDLLRSKEDEKRTSYRELAEDFRSAMSYRELGEE